VADIIHDRLASNVVIEVEGFGTTQPVHSHQTAFAQAQNRRVDIHLDVRRTVALPESAVSKASAAAG
jgi:flagellar motor protein MotB